MAKYWRILKIGEEIDPDDEIWTPDDAYVKIVDRRPDLIGKFVGDWPNRPRRIQVGPPEPSYPEHEKLKRLLKERDGAQKFYDWIRDQGMRICEYETREPGEWHPTDKLPAELIAGALDIDEDKLEAEKVAMLEHQRKLNEEKR